MEPHDGCYDDDDDYGDAFDECYDEGDSCYSDDDDEVARVLALENRRIERENRSLDDADDDDEKGGNHEV